MSELGNTPKTSNNELNSFKKPNGEYREPNIEHVVRLDHLPIFSWNSCFEDPDNSDNILLWRAISRVSPKEAFESGNLSKRAYKEVTKNKTPFKMEQFLKQFEKQDIVEVAKNYILNSGDVWHDEPSIVLHTTYDKSNALNIPYEGVIIEYSVPKSLILELEKHILASTGGESELGFIGGLPKETIKTVTWKDESETEVTMTPEQYMQKTLVEEEEEGSTPREQLNRFIL